MIEIWYLTHLNIVIIVTNITYDIAKILYHALSNVNKYGFSNQINTENLVSPPQLPRIFRRPYLMWIDSVQSGFNTKYLTTQLLSDRPNLHNEPYTTSWLAVPRQANITQDTYSEACKVSEQRNLHTEGDYAIKNVSHKSKSKYTEAFS